jgi:UDP-glucose 4-epimerase
MHNVLVTGGAGFIGRQVVKRLSEKGYRVIVIDNLSNKKCICNYNNNILLNNKISFYKEDIRNKASISHIIKQESVDTCIHLAAKVSVYDSIRNPNDTIDVNFKGTLKLLEACYSNKVKNFLFASSAAVYGEPKNLPLSEDDTLEPLSPYGLSKVSAERLISTYKKLGKIQNAVSLRLFNVYGKSEDVINVFAQRLSKGLPPVIYGDGQQIRDFISLNDVVNAITLAAEQSSKISSGVFNIGTGTPTTINELAQKMIKIFDLVLEPIYCEANNGDIKYSYANVTRAKKILKFIAADNFESNLKQMLYDFKCH